MSHYTSSCFSKCTSITFLWSLFNITSTELFNGQTYGLNKANTSTRASIPEPDKLLTKTCRAFYSSPIKSPNLRLGQRYGLCATPQPSLKLWQQVFRDPFPPRKTGKSQETSESGVGPRKTVLRLTMASIRAAFRLLRCVLWIRAQSTSFPCPIARQ